MDAPDCGSRPSERSEPTGGRRRSVTATQSVKLNWHLPRLRRKRSNDFNGVFPQSRFILALSASRSGHTMNYASEWCHDRGRGDRACALSYPGQPTGSLDRLKVSSLAMGDALSSAPGKSRVGSTSAPCRATALSCTLTHDTAVDDVGEVLQTFVCRSFGMLDRIPFRSARNLRAVTPGPAPAGTHNPCFAISTTNLRVSIPDSRKSRAPE